MPTVMITGANRGLGFEFARQYADHGWRVIATTRTPEGGSALGELSGEVEVHLLDVTDFDAVDQLAQELRSEVIDLLINNAGIYGPRTPDLDALDYGAWDQVHRVNAMAPMKVSAAFLHSIERSRHKTIATMTSKMGSMGANASGGSYIYRASKAALNAAMKSLSVDLRPRGFTVVVFHPGWVRTDMGGPGGEINAAESVTGMRRILDTISPADTGKFFNYDGALIPW